MCSCSPKYHRVEVPLCWTGSDLWDKRLTGLFLTLCRKCKKNKKKPRTQHSHTFTQHIVSRSSTVYKKITLCELWTAAAKTLLYFNELWNESVIKWWWEGQGGSHLLTALQFGFVVKNLPPLESDTGTSTVPETAIGLLWQGGLMLCFCLFLRGVTECCTLHPKQGLFRRPSSKPPSPTVELFIMRKIQQIVG